MMKMIRNEIRNNVRSLELEERVKLLEDLWVDIVRDESAENQPLTPAQMEELERRIVDHRKSPEEGVSWNELKNELLSE